MSPTPTRLIIAALTAAASPTLAAEPTAGFRIVTPEQLAWRPVPDSFGVESAIISGNPSQAGVYVIRVRFPPRVMDRPHSHSADRHVTVIKGTWYAGTGNDFDPAKAVALKPGSTMFHPSGGVHWDGANSDEEAIVQIIGTGPVTSADVDPTLKSWVRIDR